MNTTDFEAQCLSEEMGLAPPSQPPAPRTIQTVTLEIKTLHAQANQVILGYAIEIGRCLTEAKAMLEHGQWGDWLKNEVAFSKSTANNFMKIFQEYGATQMGLFGGEAKSQTIGDLPYTKALKLLALPSEEREDFLENNNVTAMSSRQLEQAIREKENATKEADQLENSLRIRSEELSETKEIVEEREREILKLSKEQESATKEVERLQKELFELAKKPVEVAIEKVVDEDAIMAAVTMAKQETEEALKKQLQKAETAQKKAEEARNTAEQALATAKIEQERVKAMAESQRQTMDDQIQTLSSKLAVASSSEITLFKLHFEQGQTSINEMAAAIARIKENGDPEGATKLTTALKAMLEQSLGVLGCG